MNRIGDRIRTKRTDRKLTQAELAKASGVGQSSISEYESGKSKPDAESLGRGNGP